MLNYEHIDERIYMPIGGEKRRKLSVWIDKRVDSNACCASFVLKSDFLGRFHFSQGCCFLRSTVLPGVQDVVSGLG